MVALHTSLDNLRGQRSKVKEHRQLEKELAVVLGKRQNLQAWTVFKLGMPVHRINSTQLGIVRELKITPGGRGEVWVSWDGVTLIHHSEKNRRACVVSAYGKSSFRPSLTKEG